MESEEFPDLDGGGFGFGEFIVGEFFEDVFDRGAQAFVVPRVTGNQSGGAFDLVLGDTHAEEERHSVFKHTLRVPTGGQTTIRGSDHRMVV